jgi:undecaprenyl-diphosphatase
MDYFQAIVLGLLQGITELFPVSSLGHTVLLPKLLGWDAVVSAQSAPESFFLAFLVGLHVATALALLVFYRRRWIAIVGATLSSVAHRRIETRDARLGWLLAVGTIPAGLTGVLLEHALRVLFATPLVAAVLLLANGGILLLGERVRRRSASNRAESPLAGPSALTFPDALAIGIAQTAALLPGISRSGITIVAGLLRGLDLADAADFAYLLATPVILGAGLYKLPDLLGPNGDGVRGQVLVGSIAAAIAAYLSVRFLTRYFQHESLLPFAVYSMGVGIVGIVVVR